MAAPKVDILVNLLTALQPFAGGVTTLPLNDADQLSDYSRLIGGIVVDHDNKISQLTSSLNTLYGYVTTLQTQMATIIANGLTSAQISLPQIMPDNAYYNVEIVVTTIGIQFNDLRNVTGISSELSSAVNYQDKIYEDYSQILKNQSSLTYPSSTLSTLSGWVSTPTTVSDTLKNMWITINDMRKAVQTTFLPVISTTCGEITVGYEILVSPASGIMTLFFIGNTTIPLGYSDSNSTITISDSITSITLPINILNASQSTTGVLINLINYGLDPYLTISTTLTYSFTNGQNICPGIISNSYLPTYNPCVNLILTGITSTSLQVVFEPTVKNNVSYLLKLYKTTSGGTFVTDSGDITNPAGVTSYIFSGLTTGTTYYIICVITISGVTNTCPASSPITL